MVARLDNQPDHGVIDRALTALDNLEHRGAEGADIRTGDGAGILVQIPDAFFRAVVDFELPPPGAYGVAVCFLPRDAGAAPQDRGAARAQRPHRGPGAARLARRAGRPRPRRRHRQPVAPAHPQLFVGAGAGLHRRPGPLRAQALRHPPDRRAGGRPRLLRPELLLAHVRVQGHADLPSAAGLLPGPQGRALRLGALALVHSRFSTNTFPSWDLAHPFRVIAHNGEINTLMGNVELDARARVAARVRAVRPRPPEGHADRAPRRLGLRDVRQRPRAADARAAARCRTRR